MKISDETRKRICSLAASGMKYEDISKEVGVCRQTVSKIAVCVNCVDKIASNSIPREVLDEWDRVTRKLRRYFVGTNSA